MERGALQSFTISPIEVCGLLLYNISLTHTHLVRQGYKAWIERLDI